MSWKKLGMEFGLQPVVAARDERLSLVQRFEYSVENREGLQFVTFDGELADLPGRSTPGRETWGREGVKELGFAFAGHRFQEC